MAIARLLHQRFFNVQIFICKISKNETEDFKKNLEILPHRAEILSQRDAFGKGVSLSTDAQQKEFFASIKNLTIQGYTSSEYVMVNYYNYEMAPGHFYGCITV